ncbi:ABC transporter G family member 31 (ABC transporter ABCG.31) (AtABCG31) (Pleiotropic drug resistance protein 3) (AtPDR3), partial [Durusdinium trenchii]
METTGDEMETAGDRDQLHLTPLRALGQRHGVVVDFREVAFVVEAADADGSDMSNFAQAAVNTFAWPVRALAAKLRKPKKQKFMVVNNVSGVLRPGSSTLLLGPPACGKSTLLKIVAGRLKHHVSTAAYWEGEVSYNGLPASQFEATKVASYVAQVDNHLPLVTVENTFKYARTVVDSDQEHVRDDIEAVMEDLGLSNAAKTVVGGLFVRGVSGGERKRTTIGEMLFAGQPVMCLDEITTGLDSSTAFEVVKLINDTAREGVSQKRGATVLMTLLQPSPELIDTFDDVIIMAEGRFLFHGPVAEAVPYFESLGYVCKAGRSKGEFLVDLTTHRRQRYFVVESGGPESVQAMADAWEAFVAQGGLEEHREAVQNAAAVHRADSAPASLGAGNKFPLTGAVELRVVLRRQLELFWADR